MKGEERVGPPSLVELYKGTAVPPWKSVCEDDDDRGFVEELYDILHIRTNAVDLPEERALATLGGLRLPHTLVYRSGALVHWYHSDESDARTGVIHSRKRSDFTTDKIMQVFGERTGPSEICAFYLEIEREQSAALAALADSGTDYLSIYLIWPHAVHLEYFDEAALRRFLHRAKHRSGILQKFVHPYADRAVTVRISWAPHHFMVDARTNKNPIDDSKQSRYNRGITQLGPDCLPVSVQSLVGPRTERKFKAMATKVVKAIEHERPNLRVRYMVLYVALDTYERPWLIYCPALRCADQSHGQSICMQCGLLCPADVHSYMRLMEGHNVPLPVELASLRHENSLSPPRGRPPTSGASAPNSPRGPAAAAAAASASAPSSRRDLRPASTGALASSSAAPPSAQPPPPRAPVGNDPVPEDGYSDVDDVDEDEGEGQGDDSIRSARLLAAATKELRQIERDVARGAGSPPWSPHAGASSEAGPSASASAQAPAPLPPAGPSAPRSFAGSVVSEGGGGGGGGGRREAPSYMRPTRSMKRDRSLRSRAGSNLASPPEDEQEQQPAPEPPEAPPPPPTPPPPTADELAARVQAAARRWQARRRLRTLRTWRDAAVDRLAVMRMARVARIRGQARRHRGAGHSDAAAAAAALPAPARDQLLAVFSPLYARPARPRRRGEPERLPPPRKPPETRRAASR
eukprot:tig00020675_g12640.t1